jgi:hypothetical protein
MAVTFGAEQEHPETEGAMAPDATAQERRESCGGGDFEEAFDCGVRAFAAFETGLAPGAIAASETLAPKSDHARVTHPCGSAAAEFAGKPFAIDGLSIDEGIGPDAQASMDEQVHFAGFFAGGASTDTNDWADAGFKMVGRAGTPSVRHRLGANRFEIDC